MKDRTEEWKQADPKRYWIAPKWWIRQRTIPRTVLEKQNPLGVWGMAMEDGNRMHYRTTIMSREAGARLKVLEGLL